MPPSLARVRGGSAGPTGCPGRGVDMPHSEAKEPDLPPQYEDPTEEEEECQQDEEEGASGSAGADCQVMLEGKLRSYFSSLDSTIELLKKKAQDIIQNINESRQKDHELMSNFRDSLKIKVSDLAEKLEERMYQIYNYHNKIIQEKLQEFTQKMTKITHLEAELKEVCHTVETVYNDLCVPPEFAYGPDCYRGKTPPQPSNLEPPDLLVSALCKTVSQEVTEKGGPKLWS
ncbi:PREDICTED: synaptonemal complex central element protein 2 [Elephantulus edwardii]|uniref:synaptonemal complex central element protein 2 n=1 Tax=Elephantulus edwardii TaxID=28737 RepID=UPI0003F0B48E|nr:PREDICTED: synaptonemal complex central element protein 2 [Elephantulus edwardii]